MKPSENACLMAEAGINVGPALMLEVLDEIKKQIHTYDIAVMSEKVYLVQDIADVTDQRDGLAVLLKEARAENAVLREMLEWERWEGGTHREERCCPVCYATPDEGPAPDCRLALLLEAP